MNNENTLLNLQIFDTKYLYDVFHNDENKVIMANPRDINDSANFQTEIMMTKKLGDEPGIKELEKLYTMNTMDSILSKNLFKAKQAIEDLEKDDEFKKLFCKASQIIINSYKPFEIYSFQHVHLISLLKLCLF